MINLDKSITLHVRTKGVKAVFYTSLSLCFGTLLSCTASKQEPPTRLGGQGSVEATPPPKISSSASEPVVESRPSVKGLVPLALVDQSLILSGPEDKHFKIALDKADEAPTLLPVEDLDGIRADGVLFRIPALSAEGTQSDWFIFNDEAKGSPRNALIALREPSGEVVFLEQGRKWFAAESKSAMQVITATPKALVMRENNSLMIIQKSNPTFSLVKVEIDFVDRIMSLDAGHMIYLGKDKKLHLVKFDTEATPATIAQKDLDLANIESVLSAGFFPKKDQIMTFSNAGNKLLDMASGEYTLFKKYTAFATNPKSVLMPIGADSLIAISPESETLEKLTYSPSSDKKPE